MKNKKKHKISLYRKTKKPIIFYEKAILYFRVLQEEIKRQS